MRIKPFKRSKELYNLCRWEVHKHRAEVDQEAELQSEVAAMARRALSKKPNNRKRLPILMLMSNVILVRMLVTGLCCPETK